MAARIAFLLLAISACVFGEAPSTTITAPVISTPEDSGFQVQTGYEGYLVPALTTPSPPVGVGSGLVSLLTGNNDVTTVLASLLGTAAPALGVERGVTGLAHAGDKLPVGGVKPGVLPIPLKHPKFPKLHTGKAAVVPKKLFLVKVLGKIVVFLAAVLVLYLFIGGIVATVCTFTPICNISFLSRENFRSLASTDKLSQITSFVLDAIDKYRELQRK